VSKRPSSIYNDPGYFYDQKRLLRIFTFSSLALVVGIVWWIWQDFDRPWKEDQRDERRWEAKRFTLERNLLDQRAQDARAQLEKMRAEAEEKVKAHEGDLGRLRRELKDAEGAFYLADMTYKEQKQYTAEAEYQVQETESDAALADWTLKLKQARDREDRLRDARKKAEDRLDLLVAREKELLAAKDAVLTEARKNPDLKRLDIVVSNIERKKGYNPAREIPLLDFLAPPVKVKQIVLDQLVDNYEFSLPKKVDRCATCHILSTEVGYDAERWPVVPGGPPSADDFEEGVYRFAFAVLENVWGDKPPANDPFRKELEEARQVAIHHATMNLLFRGYDEDTGEFELKEDREQIWRRYSRDAEGNWKEDDENGRSIASYYLDALSSMKAHWRTHPHFEDMVGGASPHPYERFGCSICHQGRGWSTDFGLAFHVPDLKQITNWMTDEWAHEEGKHLPRNAGQTLEQAMAQGAPPASSGAGASDVHTGWVTDESVAGTWEEEYDRTESKLHYWHWPQLPKMLIQASCLKCHKEGLYRTAPPEYEGVRIGKPAKAPYNGGFEDYDAAKNEPAPNRILIPAEPEPYRPENLERGLENFLHFGCYGCHKLDATVFPFMKSLRPKVGPPLDELATKTTKEWTQAWVRNPADFRADTRMPRFFGLSNSSHNFRYRFAEGFDDVNGAAWANAEIYAIVEWIWHESGSRARKYPPVDLSKGDPKRGERMLIADAEASGNEAKACIACHEVELGTADLAYDGAQLAAAKDAATRRETGWSHRMSRRQGPNLAGLASKLKPEWLYQWLKNPRGYWHDTNMPDLRLTDQEALDLTAYLMTKRHEAFDALPPVTFDRTVLDRMAEELKVAEQQESTEAALSTVRRWSPAERVLYVGKKLVKHYGCFGCHQIDAYKDATPIGTELTDWGSKLIDRLEFNHAPIERTRFAFGYTKMMNPRVYDLGMPRADKPLERLKMPRFGFSPDEARDLATFLVALVNDPIPMAARFQLDERKSDILRGREIVRRYNCQGCHVIEDEGGDIWPVIAKTKWRPPDLKGQGRKTQPRWLFDFLKDPAFVTIPGVPGSDRVRPWYSMRMPTFHFTDEEARALVRYFSALSEVPADFESGAPDSLVGPEAQYEVAKRLELTDLQDRQKKYTAVAHNRLEEARLMFQEYQCKSCHSKETAIDNAAPDFRHTRAGRLRDTWVVDWLWGPLLLQPGTAMPMFFANDQGPLAQDTQFLGGIPDEQIRALRDFIRHHYREEDR
jgi:cytochrome c2